MNREHWLTELACRAQGIFRGYKLAKYRLTCGWPSKNGLGNRSRRLGECHASEGSRDGVHEIFISPVLDDPVQVAGTVCHELAHIAAGVGAGHGRAFVAVCNHAGLTKGPPTQRLPGVALTSTLMDWIGALGVYPHGALVGVPAQRVVHAAAVVCLQCPGCGCRVTMSRRWLEAPGVPTCGCGVVMALRTEGE
jgi:hypothetical protein